MGLPQYGGEGIKDYKGNKSDAKLKQFGGEGDSIAKKGQDVDYIPGVKHDTSYTGPGRNLKSEGF